MLADKESRGKHSDIEWKLNPELFDCIVTLWGTVSVDLFASRLNYQLKPFMSWRPDPEAMAIDAFSLDWREQYFYALISSFFPNKQGTSESGTGPEPGHNHCTNVEHSSLVPQIATSFDRLSSYSSKGTKNTAPSFQSGESTPSSQDAHSSGVQIIRNYLTARGISQKAAKVILQSWRETTHKQYSIYLRKWLLFCSSRGFDPYKATPAQALDFMTNLF